jgi:hypothetical protein
VIGGDASVLEKLCNRPYVTGDGGFLDQLDDIGELAQLMVSPAT